MWDALKLSLTVQLILNYLYDKIIMQMSDIIQI